MLNPNWVQSPWFAGSHLFTGKHLTVVSRKSTALTPGIFFFASQGLALGVEEVGVNPHKSWTT
jgi:hypothetical protein